MTDEPLSADDSETASGSTQIGVDTAAVRVFGLPRMALLQLLKIGVPILSVLVAAIGVVTTVVLQRQQMGLQIVLKRSETFNSRRDVYAKFVQTLEDSYREARTSEWAVLMRSFHTLENSFLQVEPFMSEVQRQIAWSQLSEFEAFCKDAWKLSRDSNGANRNLTGEFVDRRERIKGLLRKALFDE
jgi:hypothetical protein